MAPELKIAQSIFSVCSLFLCVFVITLQVALAELQEEKEGGKLPPGGLSSKEVMSLATESLLLPAIWVKTIQLHLFENQYFPQ